MNLSESFPVDISKLTPEQIIERDRFMKLIDGMDIPKQRIVSFDYRWI